VRKSRFSEEQIVAILEVFQVRQTKGRAAGRLEKVFGVSLPLGQEHFSAARAKGADGVDALAAAWAGQSLTPEVAASLLRRLDEQSEWGGCQPLSGCEAPG
jgi:hypothetical protein